MKDLILLQQFGPSVKRRRQVSYGSMVSEKEKKSNSSPLKLSDEHEDANMWFFEHYEKERLRSIGAVE